MAQDASSNPNTASTSTDNTVAYIAFVAAPAITGLNPTSGTTAGGTSVIITGTNFVVSGASAVTFGGTNATSYLVNSTTQITAVAPAHTAGAVRVQVVATGGTTADTSADDYTFVAPVTLTRIDQTDGSLVWSGTWAVYSTTSAYGGGYKRSSTAGAYVVIPFNGTRLDWIATKGTTTGKADVYLDNVFVTTIDLAATSVAYQQDVWSTGTLASGYHTVKILRNSTGASGRYITIDAVDVAGNLVPAVRKEQTEPLLVWTPSLSAWTLGTSISYSGGSYRYSNTSGASVTINFTGVSLEIIAKTAPSYGNATITIDGVSKAVSFYSSTTTYKKTVWSSGFLAPGNHTVTITRAGTKSTSSTGYTIDLDAVDVRGVLR